jgi:type IV pilus assembly protein PilN
MANINLLPWRADRRKQREREFYMMLLATAVAACAVVLAAILWMGHLIDNQDSRNAYLQDQIKGLDKQIEEIAELDKTRSALLTRKEIIEQLQSNRSQMVHLFDEMVKTIPDGARLSSMKQTGDVMTLEGVAESNSRVASYMRNVDVSPWMGHTDLRKIENKAGTKDIEKKMPYAFSLDVALHKPKGEKDVDAEDGGAAAAPNPAAAKPAAVDDNKPGLGAQVENAAGKLTAKPATAAVPAASSATPAAASNTTTEPAPPPKTPATGEKK